jgi:hypothetical protein
MLVNFILVGAQKAGTTSLSCQLAQHPQIGFCQHKEPNFFSQPIKGYDTLEDYHSLFSYAPGRIYGEASTTYTWLPQYPETARRIHKYNADMKLIYIMRNPVERILSHYTYRLLKARTRLPVDQEILADPSYVNRSRYSVQLKPYLELFPVENVMLIIFEEYVKNPERTLETVAHHLGVNPLLFRDIDLTPQNRSLDRPAETRLKKRLTPIARLFPMSVRNALRNIFTYELDEKPRISDRTRKVLWWLLEPDIEKIGRIIGRDLTIWH